MVTKQCFKRELEAISNNNQVPTLLCIRETEFHQKRQMLETGQALKNIVLVTDKQTLISNRIKAVKNKIVPPFYRIIFLMFSIN